MKAKKALSLFMTAVLAAAMLTGCGKGRGTEETLVAETVSIIDSLLSGNGMPATEVTANNGVIAVPVYELPPVVVTKDNAKEVFADDPDRLALLTD